MASLLQADAFILHYGYFYTREFTEIVTYLQNLLNQHDESFRVTIHASALFASPDDVNIVQELHMPSTHPVTLDPEMPNFDDIIQNLFEELTAPELYENIEGSGWTLLPDTYTFWVNTIPYQPNNDANANRRNTNQLNDDLLTDNDDSLNTHGFCVDTLCLSIAAHHIAKKRYDTKLTYLTKCQNWIRDNLIVPEHKIHLSNLADWHLMQNKFWIRVFSVRGNVLYQRSFNLSQDNESLIDILWKNKKFTLITDLWGLLKEKNDRIFCEVCKKFHASSTQCKALIKGSPTESMQIYEVPEGRHGLVIYADFESIIRNTAHEASGYSLIAINKWHDVLWQETIDATMTDCVPEHFIKTLIAYLDGYAKYIEATSECQICGRLLSDEDNIIVGRNYINNCVGSHCYDCWNDNKNCAIIYFHNFRGYDSHYLIKYLMLHTEIKMIRGKSFEKFDLITAHSGPRVRMCFKDTFNYFNTSLANMASTITQWRVTDPKDRAGKGIFPYDWFDTYDKLNYPQLPEKEHWFNKILNKNTYEDEVQQIWTRENMTHFKDYHNYYMLRDVCLLCDVFEEFRNKSIINCKYDPVYFQGAPSYTWYLCTNEYSEKFKIIKNPNIYLDIQANIRGGISQVMQRYQEVENNEKILYLDINSLYSKCMTYRLPNLYIKTIYELSKNWMDIYCNSDLCAIMCVDLVYPEHLHDEHIDFPLAPHKYENRLCATFHDKKKYLLHSENLKFYLEHGLILEKFHYAYIFTSENILEEYVTKNIEKRRATDSPILQTLYKLLNNSLYGKTCENKFKYKKFSVKSIFYGIDGKRNPFLFKSRNWMQIDNNILSEDDISNIVLDKPIQLGFGILEWAKLEMYKFIYALKKSLTIEYRLLYTDTDSLLIWFNHPTPQNLIFESMKEFLDFEHTPDDWTVRTINTDKVSGLWSLETKKEIQYFIGLRAKCYALKFTDNTSTLKNKGIIRAAVDIKNNLPLIFDSYKRALFEDEEIYVQQVLIRSKLHEISSITQKKLALSSLDEKRCVLADKITTIPWGYKGEKYSNENTQLSLKDLL